MSTLTSVLQKEFNRLEEQKFIYEKKLCELPKGYISRKNIRGNIAYYLQYRDNGKIVSKYISKNLLEDIEAKILERKQTEQSLKVVLEEQNRLRKVLVL